LDHDFAVEAWTKDPFELESRTIRIRGGGYFGILWIAFYKGATLLLSLDSRFGFGTVKNTFLLDQN
jgi:hypothetical protein